MITYDSEQMKPQEEAALREWLIQGPAQTVRRVVDSLLAKEQVKALEHATACPNETGFAGADATLARASKYLHFLQVLDELCGQPADKRFEIARLSLTRK